jgi:hypothetical protein
MLKRAIIVLFVCLAFCPYHAWADKSFYSDGMVDNNNGTPNKHLAYKDFEVTSDGRITGVIVNASNQAFQSLKLDMWTTNPAETRIFWRKSLNIGDLAPKGEFQVNEPYSSDSEGGATVVFKFRIPSGANFRNPK